MSTLSTANKQKISDIFSKEEIKQLTSRSDAMGFWAISSTWVVIAATFAGPLGLGDAFILENVRYELLIVSFFVILFSGTIPAIKTQNMPTCFLFICCEYPKWIATGFFTASTSLVICSDELNITERLSPSIKLPKL